MPDPVTGRDWAAGPLGSGVGAVGLAVLFPVVLGVLTVYRDDQLATSLRPVSPVSTNPPPVMKVARWLKAEVAPVGGAAALDVAETEPLPQSHTLMSFPQVTLTPHMAWYSEESYGELKRRTVENVAVLLTGERPRNIVNPEVLGAPGRNAGFADEAT